MATSTEALDQWRAIWRGWTLERRISLLVGILFCLVAFGALLYLGTSSTYVPLMTNLSPEDAAEVTAGLQERAVPYKLSGNGSIVNVPEEKVHEMRIALAAEGLPKGGGVGYSIFNEPRVGMSRFAEQLNYRRALEGELRKTIRELDAIRDARVHIVVPERSLFAAKKSNATASVTLNLHSGRNLNREQVQAITHLVASSVMNLNPNDVTIIDSKGTILSKGGTELGASSETLEYQRSIERILQERVEEILQPALGRGRISVRVNADIDLTKKELTKEDFDPDVFVARSTQTTEEAKGAGGGLDSKGVPGARSTLTGASTGAGANGFRRRSETQNYEISKVTSHEIHQIGKIKRVSVAVLVDGVENTSAEGEKTIVPRSDEELRNLESLVKKAVGFDPTRGDEVEIQSMVFKDRTAIKMAETDTGAKEPAAWIEYAKMFWRPALALLLIIVIVILFLTSKKKIKPEIQQILDRPATVRELEAAMVEGKELPEKTEKERPEADKAAAVLKTWIAEG